MQVSSTLVASAPFPFLLPRVRADLLWDPRRGVRCSPPGEAPAFTWSPGKADPGFVVPRKELFVGAGASGGSGSVVL